MRENLLGGAVEVAGCLLVLEGLDILDDAVLNGDVERGGAVIADHLVGDVASVDDLRGVGGRLLGGFLGTGI